MTEVFYTPEQLVAMIRFTDHSKCRGKSVYAESSSLLRAFRFACDQYRAINGDDNLGQEYTQSLKRRAFSRELIDRIFPYIAGIKNSKGLPMKFVDYEISAPRPATEISTVPPIDPAYTAQVVHAAAQRELERASPFDRIRHVDQQGEWWDARELQGVLGYQASWQNFENAIEKAKLSLVTSDGLETDHFNDIIKMIEVGKGGQRPVNSYRLSRHACHLIAQNGDPSKPEIAAAQLYFSVQTRRAELMDAGLSAIERTAHIDALVSGQQQLTAVVEGIEDDTKMALSKIDLCMKKIRPDHG